jgi:hypothetical protein
MLILPWLLAIGFAAVDEFVLSRLLRREYSDHRSIWESDGKPRGIFWIPQECVLGGWYVSYKSGRAGRTLALKWLFQTPHWISQNADSHKLLIAHRILMYAFIVSALAPFVLAALFQ